MMPVTNQKLGAAALLALGVLATGVVAARQPQADQPPEVAQPKAVPPQKGEAADAPGSIDVELRFGAEGPGSPRALDPIPASPELLQVRLDARRGEREKAEAQRELALAKLARYRRLNKMGKDFVGPEDMAGAEAEAKIAEAERHLKEAQVREAEILLAEAQQRRAGAQGTGSAPEPGSSASLETRLRQIERKLDLILERLGTDEKK
jgi:hypothetical protein